MSRPAPRKSAAGSLAGFVADLGPADRVYLRPVGLMPLAAWETGAAVPLAGTGLSFAMGRLIVRRAKDGRAGGGGIERAFAPLSEIMAWGFERGAAVARRLDDLLAALTRARAPFAGLSLDRARVMGIVNVTPDSFSDGGRFIDPAVAVNHGVAMMAAGADILDIGGESTRPGAEPVGEDEEIRRVAPVIAALVADGACVSVDTRHAGVMRAALDAGARIINDVTALTGDPGSLAVAAASTASVVLMHMRGEPGTMQDDPRYDDVALDVFDHLEERVGACVAAGIPLDRIAIDPGIGFGKTADHNTDLLSHTALFHGLGVALLYGVSRKRMVAALSRGEGPMERLGGSLAAGLTAVAQGCQILRVHDVAQTAQALAVWRASNRT